MQSLRQVRLVDALALAGTAPLRPAEYVQKIRREGLVRQHDRPPRRVLILRQASEGGWTVRDLADGIEQDLGTQTLRVITGERLLVVFVELVRGRAELVGAALANRADQMLQAVAMFHQLLGQSVEQLR